MCTTVAKWLNDSWVLAKTRDPVKWMRWDDEIKLFDTSADRFRKLIIQNPNEKEDGYYGGINEQGVAYVSTFVLVAENQVSYIRRPYVRLILEAATAKEAVDIIESFNPRIGGNMFVADKHECYGIGGVPEEYLVEKVPKEGMVKTNHFVKLKRRNISFDKDKGFEDWSKTHQERAGELLGGVESVVDMKALLQDRRNSEEKQAICTTKDEEECFTHSAFVFDTALVKAHYAQGNPLEVEFEEFRF